MCVPVCRGRLLIPLLPHIQCPSCRGSGQVDSRLSHCSFYVTSPLFLNHPEPVGKSALSSLPVPGFHHRHTFCNLLKSQVTTIIYFSLSLTKTLFSRLNLPSEPLVPRPRSQTLIPGTPPTTQAMLHPPASQTPVPFPVFPVPTRRNDLHPCELTSYNSRFLESGPLASGLVP